MDTGKGACSEVGANKILWRTESTGVGKSRFTVVSMRNRVYSCIIIIIIIYLFIIVLFICISLIIILYPYLWFIF
jgi:hypothetical protein